MGYWVNFTADGIPSHFSGSRIDGAEWVEGATDDVLCTMRRADGKWVLRDPEPDAPSDIVDPESLARAEAEASEAREMEIVRRAGPDQLLRAMGRITIAELTARVAEIRKLVEAGQ